MNLHDGSANRSASPTGSKMTNHNFRTFTISQVYKDLPSLTENPHNSDRFCSSLYCVGVIGSWLSDIL
jgi:hypothetical protein